MFTPGTPGSGHGRSLRLAAVLTALIVLLGVVAVASRSGFGGSSRARPSPEYVSWAMSVFFVVWALMIPVAAYVYWLQMREFRAQNTRSFQARLARSIAVILVVPLVVGAIMYFRSRHGLFGGGLHFPSFIGGGTEAGGKHGARRYSPAFQWPVLWATLALIAASAGYVWWRWRRAGDAAPSLLGEPSVADDVAESIGDAIDDLEAEPDARRAVIAAYARMESVFARHGMHRRASETPIEYLRRLLLGLTSRADAVTRLTGLFERAKFSRHDIDGTMKQDAIDALRAIRDDLQPA
jgi:uncharacterized protein DUF4129